jgi:NitT/TauT family transport system substrate-binding protein
VGRRGITLRLAMLAGLLVALFAATGCGSGSASGSGSGGDVATVSSRATGRPEQTDITFGVVPTIGYAPVFLAQQRGFFRDEGLDVTTRIINPATTVPSLVGGDIDIAGVTWISFLVSTNRGIPLTVVHEEERGTPGYTEILVKEGSDIRSVDDLVGKKVASPGPPDVCSLVVADLLRRRGLDADSVRFTGVAIPDMPGTLAQGGVDAACMPEPAASGAKGRGGFRTVVDVESGDFDQYPLVTFATTSKFAQANPNTIGALGRALDRASAEIARDPSIVRAIMPGVMRLPPAAFTRVALPKWATSGDGPPNLALVARLLRDSRVLEGEVRLPDTSQLNK